jgi:hypothetical protein
LGTRKKGEFKGDAERENGFPGYVAGDADEGFWCQKGRKFYD